MLNTAYLLKELEPHVKKLVSRYTEKLEELRKDELDLENFKLDINKPLGSLKKFVDKLTAEEDVKKFLTSTCLTTPEILQKADDRIKLKIKILCEKFERTGRTLYRCLAIAWEAQRRHMDLNFAKTIIYLTNVKTKEKLEWIEIDVFAATMTNEAQSGFSHKALTMDFISKHQKRNFQYDAKSEAENFARFHRWDIIIKYLFDETDKIKNGEKPEKPKELEDPFSIFAHDYRKPITDWKQYFKNNEDEVVRRLAKTYITLEEARIREDGYSQQGFEQEPDAELQEGAANRTVKSNLREEEKRIDRQKLTEEYLQKSYTCMYDNIETNDLPSTSKEPPKYTP